MCMRTHLRTEKTGCANNNWPNEKVAATATK